MTRLFRHLWADDGGALLATEWIFIATILVLGLVTGLVALRQAAITELEDFANAVLSLNQSFSFGGQSNCQSSMAGSAFSDLCDSIVITSVPASCTGVGLGNPCD